MDVELRRSLLSSLEGVAPRHQLPPPAHTALLLRRAHAPPVSALDAVYAIMALIEHVLYQPYMINHFPTII